MENQIQLFSNPEFGQVRVVEIGGVPWFVAADICRVLELTNPTVALERLDTDERAKFNLGRQGEANIVNEAGLYSLILSSRKPEAKQFKRWLVHEVIPAIRKTGMYINPQAPIDPRLLRRIADELEQAQLERDQFKALADEREVTIKELKPKADYCALILQSDEALPTRTIADDYGWSAQHLNNILKDFGIIYKAGKSWLVKQAFRGRGYTVKIPSVIKGGHTVTNTYWTQKGRMFIYTFLKQRGVLPLCERDENLPALF